MSKYYVYTHQDSDGNVFYVGKGTARRAWDTNRTKVWKNKINQIGTYEVSVPYDKLTEDEAYDCEALLIELYGIDNLVNTRKESPKSDTTLYYDILQKAKDLQVLFEILDNFDYYWKHKPTRDKLKEIIFISKLHDEVKTILTHIPLN
jgi:hypothetical protein